MQRAYSLPVGANGIGLTLQTRQIVGVRVDNPSGSWLRVSGIYDSVPPYTLGWQASLSPSALHVDCKFTDSPSGTPSNLVGGPVIITLYDESVSPSPGYPSGGEQSQQPGSVRSTFVAQSANATEAGVIIPYLTVPAGFTIVPELLTVSAALPGLSVNNLRSMVSVAIIDGVGNGIFPTVIISPESPFQQVAALAVPFSIGNSIELSAVTQIGGGSQVVLTRLQYYTVRNA